MRHVGSITQRTLLLGCIVLLRALHWEGCRTHLHEAVRVRVVVHGRAVVRAPAQDHQVELAVAFIHKVAGVPAAEQWRPSA